MIVTLVLALLVPVLLHGYLWLFLPGQFSSRRVIVVTILAELAVIVSLGVLVRFGMRTSNWWPCVLYGGAWLLVMVWVPNYSRFKLHAFMAVESPRTLQPIAITQARLVSMVRLIALCYPATDITLHRANEPAEVLLKARNKLLATFRLKDGSSWDLFALMFSDAPAPKPSQSEVYDIAAVVVCRPSRSPFGSNLHDITYRVG